MGILDAPGYSRGQADSRFINANRLRAATLLTRLASSDAQFPGDVAPAADQPTITTGSAWTITTGQQVNPGSGLITQVGMRGSWNNSLSRWDVNGSGEYPGIDFYLTGTTIEFAITPQTASTPVWVAVNGRFITATPTAYATTANAAFIIKLAFASSTRRRIEVFATPVAAYYPVRCGFDHLITPAPRRPAIAWVGDSFFAGSNGAAAFDSSPFRMARLLGAEPASVSYGGTGYVAAGSFNTFGSTARVNAVAAYSPELIVMSGSVNDDMLTGRQAAAAETYAAYGTALPNARIIVWGPQPSNAADTIGVNRQANIAAIKAAALAAPNVIAFHDMVGTAAGIPVAWDNTTTFSDGQLVTYKGSVWRYQCPVAGANVVPGTNPRWVLVTYAYFGTGTSGAPAGDGTRDAYLYSDGVHPTPEGNAGMSIRQLNDLRADLLAASVA